MKKISLFITAALLSTALFAQSSANFGLKGGLNIASLKVEDQESSDSRLGLHLGALAHIHLAPQFALQPEVVYSQQGMKTNVTGTETTFKLDYINIPLMLQYMFSNGFRLEAGPQLGFLINAQVGNLENKEDYKSTDVALGVGLGYLSTSGLGINGRYNFGLTNINEFDPNNNVTNRVGQISLFYMFNRAHKVQSR
jgi:opacity protein-like surface antigen